MCKGTTRAQGNAQGSGCRAPSNYPLKATRRRFNLPGCQSSGMAFTHLLIDTVVLAKLSFNETKRNEISKNVWDDIYQNHFDMT